MKVLGVIPARWGSTRFEAKVLASLAGKPMIQHVWERAKQAKRLTKLIIATDHADVEKCAKSFGANVMMTRVNHPNGSSRVAEVASREEVDIIINIQGDEPMIHPQAIDQLAAVFESHPDTHVATLAVPRTDREDYTNPNVVKVVVDQEGDALYFSRSPIPYLRDADSPLQYLKHLGIYGYRKEFLLEFVTWSTGRLEEAEKLEQLRILEQDYKIRVIPTPYDSWSVDTAEDLKLVEGKIGSQI